MKPAAELGHVHPVDAEDADSAALVRTDRRDHLHPIARGEQLVRPAVAQVAEPSDLAVHPNAAVERDRHRDRVMIRRGWVPISSYFRMLSSCSIDPAIIGHSDLILS